MVQHIEMQDLLDRILDILYTGITELHHLVTLCTDQVIMLFVTIRLFVLREVFAKLVFTNQVTFDEKVKRVINRCPAYPVVLVFHADVERFHIKMTVAGVDLLQDRVAFRGLT